MLANIISFFYKIKEFIIRVPVMGFLIWFVYMIVKKPSRITLLFSELDRVKSRSKEDPDNLYMRTQDSLQNYNSEGLERNKHFFFVLGTPRSGTKWFSHFLTTDEVFCFHELTLMCYESLRKHQDASLKFKPIPQSNTDESVLYSQLRTLLYLYPSFGRLMYHKLYESERYIACGNSDCVQTNIPLALQHVFPKSRFLIILRNGFDVALSVEKKMEELADKIIENHKKNINKNYGYQCKNFFEIACWRWRIGTEKILEASNRLMPGSSKIVSFERVFSNIEVLREIWDFLLDGKVQFDRQRAEVLLDKRINAGGHQKIEAKTISGRWAGLEGDKRNSFMRIGGSVMKNLPYYEGWPDLDF